MNPVHKLEIDVRLAVENFLKDNPELEIHSVIVSSKYNYVTKQIEHMIRADVRDKGRIFLGMSS